MNGSEQRVFEYETDDTLFAVGDIDGEPTHFDGYPFSGLNRAIVQHALHEAGLGGQSVHAVSGLPVSSFYLKDGSQRMEVVERKRNSLKQAVQPIDGRLPAAIAFHEVIPEALAAWYDHIITEANGGVQLESERLSVPVAVVDIGGRRRTSSSSPIRRFATTDPIAALRTVDLKRQVGESILWPLRP